MQFAALLLTVTSSMFLANAYLVPDTVETRSESHYGFIHRGTYYAPGLGACGKTNTADQLIVAVGHGVFDSFPGATANPNNNPICGKKLRATYGQHSVIVTVEDRCAGCAGAADLDFTETGFAKLAPIPVGRIHGVKWEWV